MKKYHWPRRVLSLLLCLVLALGFFPTGIVSQADAAITTGYVTDNLVLHLDANNNTGSGHDPNATTWKNLAAGGENIKINGQAWGTDATYGTHYLNFNENYILLPDSVRQALSGAEFTIEFVLDNFVDGGSGINNIMCVTAADSYISQFKANDGTKDPAGVVNDNFVIFAWAGSSHSFRTCYGSSWSTINNYASIGNSAVNHKTNSLTFSSTAGSKWYQDGVQKDSGSNVASGRTITLDGYKENGTWQTTNLPQIAFGAATDVMADRHFKANVRSIRIYADTLTADEMKQNAAQDNENFYTEVADPCEGYVTDNLVLYLDANNNTGIGYDNEATTWKNLAGNGEMIKTNGHDWGTDTTYGTHYLDMDGYIILPESVRQAIASGVFTIEFVMDDYVGEPTNTTGDIVNLMALTGSDRWIAATTTKGSTPNDNFVIYQHNGEKWARFKTNSAPAHADRAMVGGGVNGKTQTITYNSGSVVWYQDTVSVDSSTGYNAVPNVSSFTGAQSGEVPQVIFGAATDTVDDRAFSGKVRAIRVYKDILTADEIKKNAEKDQNYHYGPVGYDEGYVSRNLILHLDANNNTGKGYDPNATTWKNLANGGENIKLNGQTWGSEQLYDSNYLTFTDDYILLPDSVRQTLAGTEFTIEFVLDNFKNGSSGINNIMCVTGADSYIAKFKANGGTMNAGAVVNDNFVVWSNVNQEHNLRTYYGTAREGTGKWAAINDYAKVDNGSLNQKTHTLQFSSTAGNKWYQDGTLISSGKNKVSGKTMTLDGYIENDVWQTTNLPQIAFGAATDVVSGRHFNANVRAVRIYAGTLTEAEIAKNAALDAKKYYTVDEAGMDALAQESWNAVVGGTTALDSNTTLAGIQAYAESKLQSSLITVTVADAGNGAFNFTYKLKSTGETIDTHTLYVDTEYTLDMAQLTTEQQTALMNDLAQFSGSGTIAVKWDDTAKAVNYKGTRNGNPVSHLYFPIYSSGNAYVYEAEVSFVSDGDGWSTLSFAADQTLEHMQYAFWGSAGATATGAEIVRFQNPANHGGTFAVGHVNTGMDTVVTAMGDKWEDTYTYNSTKKTYTVTDTVTYKVVVYEKTVYTFIDGTQVLMAPVSGTLHKELNGVFGFNTSKTSMNIHKFSVRPITEDNEEEELAGINLRFNPVKSYNNDIYEPDTDVNTAPIVMQSADADTKNVSELAKRPSALIFDLKVEEGVLKAYDGETLLGNFADLYALNQPKTNVGVRLTLGDTDTADALIEWALANRVGNLWAISNDVELLERITDQVNVIRGVVDFTGDVVRGPSDVKYNFDTNGDGTIKENANVTDATLGKVDVSGGEYADKTAPIFTYKNYTGGYEALKWSEIYDIVITCGHRNVLLPERVIDKEYVYYLQGSLITVFVETDATTETEFYDLIVTGVNGILSTEFDTNIAVLESDIFDVNGEELNVRGGHVVGHRGDMGYHVLGEATLPENSIESIVSGAQSGISSVEFDVYMTKDGELVLNHNTSIKGFFVYEDTCPLTEEQRISEDVTIVNRYWKGDLEYMVSTYNPNIKMQRLYQLYEAVDTEYPELRLHHEMKDTRIETQNRIIDLMTQYGLRDRSDMMSTNYAAIQYSSSMGISSQYLSTPSSKDTPDRIYEAEASYRPVNSTWHTQWPSIDTDYLEELKHYGETAYPWATYAGTYAARYVQGYQGFTTDAPHHTDDIIRLLTPDYDLDTGKVSVVARTLAYHEDGVFNDTTISGEKPIRLPDYLQEWWADENCSHYVSDQENEYDLTGFEVLALSGGENVEISGDTVTFKEGATGDAVLVVRYKQALDNQSSFYIYSNTMTVSAGKITGYDVTANDPATYDGTAKVSATVTRGTPNDAEITYVCNGTPYDTVPSFTEAGTYEVSYTISRPNYADVTSSYTFTINNASASALNVVATGVDKVYDGVAAAPSVTAIAGATVEYSTDNQNWSTTASSYTDVVDTTVYYRVSKSGYDIATGSVSVKITNAAMTGITVEPVTGAVYNTAAQESATVVIPAGAAIQYSTDGGNTWSSELPKFTDAKTYTVQYKITKANYNDVTDSYEFTIANAPASALNVVADNIDVVYDGTAKTVAVSAIAGATIEYSTDGGQNWSTTAPSYTDVVNTTVAYRVSKTNYDTATGSVSVKISAATLTGYDVKGNDTAAYDGNAKVSATVTIPTGAAIQYSTDGGNTWSSDLPEFADAKTYTVQYKITKANYNDVTGSYNFTITNAPASELNVVATGVDKVYDAAASAVSVTAIAGATIEYSTDGGQNWTTTAPSFTDVVDTTVAYRVSKTNYDTATGNVSVKITNATMTGITVEPVTGAVYNTAAQESATVVIPTGAAIKYSTDGQTWVDEIPEFTDAGTYTVQYKVTKANYNDVAGSYEFTITNAPTSALNVVANDIDEVYDGTAKTVSVTTIAGATVEYSVDGGQNWSTTAPSFTDVVETTVAYRASKTNYDTATGNVSVKITNATMTGITVEPVTGAVYNTAAQASATAVIPTGAAIQYSTDGQTWVDEIPEFTDAGTYTVQYKVTKANYNDVTGSYQFTIANAPASTLNVVADDINVVYDGTAKAVEVTAIAGATIEYSTDNGVTWDTVAPSFTDVVETTVAYRVSKTNYETATGSVSVKIAKADMPAYDVAAVTGAVYTGAAQASAIANIPDGASISYICNGTPYTEIPEFTDAGTYEVEYTITKDNYNSVTDTYTFTIAKAAASELNVVATGVDKVYDAAASAVSVTAIDGATIEYSLNNIDWVAEAPSFTDVVDTTVYYRVTKANYNDVTGEVAVKIAKADMTVTADDIEKVYDGTAAGVVVNAPEGAAIEYSVDGGEWTAVAPVFTDAGEATVAYRVTKANYNDVTGEITVMITKADMTVTADDIEKVYDGTAAGVVVNAPEGAVIEYSLNNADWVAEAPSFTDVVDTTVYYRVTKANYNDVTGEIAVMITKATLTGYEVKGNEAAKYDGQAKASATVTLPEGAAIEYSVDGENWSSELPKFTAVGEYEVSYKITKANYNDVTGKYEFTIEKGELTGYEVKASDEVKYDGEAKPSADVTLPEGAKIEYKWTEDGEEKTSDTAPEFTDAATYEVEYTISKDGYNDVKGSYEFTVEPAKLEGVKVEAAEKTEYTGKNQIAAVIEDLPEDADFYFALFDEDGKLVKEYAVNEVPEFTEVGKYNLGVAISKGSNYEPIVEYFTFEITEKAPETGDSAALGLWMTMLTVSALGIALFVVLRRRNKKA